MIRCNMASNFMIVTADVFKWMNSSMHMLRDLLREINSEFLCGSLLELARSLWLFNLLEDQSIDCRVSQNKAPWKVFRIKK